MAGYASSAVVAELDEEVKPSEADVGLVKVDGECRPNDFLLQSLDALEVRVEKMRETARSIEDERTTLLDSLNTMMQSKAIDHLSEAEREELGLYIDRLITRCLTVEITIQTVRTPAQEQSFQKVKGYLRDLIDTLCADVERSRQRLQLYLNSCLDECGDSGAVDDRFQGAILGCAAEDQKMIKKKLQQVRESLDKSEEFVSTLKSLSLDL